MPTKPLSKLYKIDSNGNIQTWSVVVEGDAYVVTEGIEGGKLTSTKPHTCVGTNVGKKNETTNAEQALKEAKALHKKKLKTGYSESKDGVTTNNFQKPMKGDKWVDREEEVTGDLIVQDKLNGIRYQSVKERSFSTGGETFYTTPHIRAELDLIFKDHPNAFIDGEGFNPELRKNLNRLIKLVSVVIKEKDLTEELLESSKEIVQLHVFDGYGFDGVKPEDPYTTRHAALKKLLARYKFKYIFLTDYKVVKTKAALLPLLDANKDVGGEGLMIRWDKCPFKHGRSKYMLKMKHFEDAEFEIVDIQEGNGDWAGCAKRIILKLNTPATNETKDTTFAANIEGDMEWLRELYENKAEVIGQMATVTYQQLSEYQIPQLPWVTAIRNYE